MKKCIDNLSKINFIIIFMVLFHLLLCSYYLNSDMEPFSDENSYYYSAKNIIKYNILTDDRDGSIYREETEAIPSTRMQPGYPLYLSFIMRIVGDDVSKIRNSNMILQILLCLFFIKLLFKFKIQDKIKIITIAIFLLYPGFSYNTNRLLTELPFTILIISSAICFVTYIQENKYKDVCLSSVLLTIAIYFRVQGFPLILFYILFILLFMEIEFKRKMSSISLILGIFILMMFPWWIRNYNLTNKFILFNEAGGGASIWGALPYFIGIFDITNESLSQVIEQSISIDKFIFIRWRIFGFFQFMLADVWDEYLVHSFKFFRFFLSIHHIIVLPTISFMWIKIRKFNMEELFISMYPWIFISICMPFHGLPRYVWPSLPFVFVIFGILLEKIFYKEKYISNNKKSFFIKLYKVFIFFIGFFLIYSIYIFSFTYMKKDICDYRLKKYGDISIEKVEEHIKNGDIVSEEKILLTSNSNVVLNNINIESILDNKVYCKNLDDGYAIIDVNNINLINSDKKVITKIDFNFKGGYIFDYIVIYWKDSMNEFSEERVYTIPNSCFISKRSIYIDDDVKSIRVVPVKFRGGSFSFSDITIKKIIY